MKDIVDKLQDSLEYEFNLSFSERKQLLELIEKKDKEILQLKLDKNELMKTGFECCDKVRDLYKSRIHKAKEEIERLNNIINHTRRTLGEYKHYSTPTEEQNKENEDIVDKAYMELCINLKELKGSDKE